MIPTEELEQRSEEWRQARVGCVTASGVADVIARNKPKKGQAIGEYSAKRASYFDMIVAERMTGKPQDWKEVWSLTQRSELEPEARDCYTFYTGNEVQLVGFVLHPTIEMAGASPDGLVGDDGMIEMKCLDPKNHLKLFEGDESIMREYLPQMDFGLACTGRQWCDFLSYCPWMKEERFKSFIQRVPRDGERIATLEASVREFLAEVDAKIERLLALAGGKTPLEAVLEKSLAVARETHA